LTLCLAFSALDSLSLLGFTGENPDFEFKILRDKDKDAILWITLAVCRVLNRLYSK